MFDEDDDEELVGSQLTQAIENQLRDGNPECVQAVLNKLTLVGVERDEAIAMMAYVLSVEIRQVLEQGRGFDADNYERMLRALPDLPDDAP